MSTAPAPAAAPSPAPARRPPTWIFGLTGIPYGVNGAFSGITVGRMLSLRGVDKFELYGTVAISLLPAALQFTVSPLTALWMRRRSWLIVAAIASALLAALACFVPVPERMGTFRALVFASALVNGLISACNGGLMATAIPDEERGRASGWLNTGNLGGGAISAGVALWLLDRTTTTSGPTQAAHVVGLATAAMMIVPSLAALLVEEAPAIAARLADKFGAMGRELWQVLRSRPGWTGFLVCLSPVGTAAGTNMFSGMADTYHASPDMVTWATGFASGFVQAAGALAGGWLCDRINRRTAYLVSGVLTAVCGVVMALGPMTPTTYLCGTMLYLLVSGLCYAAFTAFVLEVIGRGGSSAPTRYSLFTAAGNLGISYVIWLNGLGSHVWEQHVSPATAPRGLLLADAAQNLAGVAALVALFALLRSTTPAPDGGAASDPRP